MADVLASASWVPTVGDAQMMPGIVSSAQQKACLEQSGGNIILHTVSVSAVHIVSTNVDLQCRLAFCNTYCFSALQTGKRLEAQHQRWPDESGLQSANST